MATADEYATWIVQHADKRGTPEFETVATAYQDAMYKRDGLAPKSGKPMEVPKSEAYMQGRQEPGGLRGLVNALQGPTFGFADELGGAIGGLYKTYTKPDARHIRKGSSADIDQSGSFGDNYTRLRDDLRGASDRAKEDAPILSAVTQSMAAAPTLAISPFARLLPGATGIPANMLRAGLSGATTGAVSGVGTSTAEDIRGMARDSAVSAATGGALGAVTVPVGSVLGAVAGNVRQRVSESAAVQAARAKIAEALARDARGNQFRQGFSANPTDQAAARYTKLGEEARVVDAGGQNTRQLLDTLSVLPGRTKADVERAIHSRQAGRGDRMIEAADNALGAQGRRQAETIEGLMQVRQERAAPLYERLYKTDVPIDAELGSIVSAAEQLGATKLGRDIATGKRMPYTLDQAEALQSGRYSLADLDHLKQALDTQIMTKGTDRGTGKLTPLGVSLDRLRQGLVGYLDNATGGAYKQARDAFAGPTAVMDAVNAGRSALRRDDAAISSMTVGMSDSELEGFKIGAFEALRGKLGTRAGQTEIMEMWREPAVQEKLKAIFGNERAYREFASRVAAEARMKPLEGVGRGSQTAARQFAAGDLDTNPLVEAGKAANALSTGNALSLIGIGRNAWNRVKTPEPVRDAIGNALLSSGDRGYRNLLSLSELVDQINNAKALNASRVGMVGGLGGNAFSNALSGR